MQKNPFFLYTIHHRIPSVLPAMKNPFQPGDIQTYRTTVTDDKLARFDAGLVHPVYSTFALAKDAEWACRLFVLEMKEDGEEGIGSYISVEHMAPAPLGSDIIITATLVEVIKNRIQCRYAVHSGNRLIATGEQTQKIIAKDKFDQLLAELNNIIN
jgi:fluoroacetyl-CoA thioesterase